MSYPAFPPLEWLGHSLDLTTATPLDITVLSESVKRSRQIIDVDPEENTRLVEVAGVQYKIPKIVNVVEDTRNLEGIYVTYLSGGDTLSSFQSDTSRSGRYLALSSGVSIIPALRKSFIDSQQYAFFSFNSTQYVSGLRNYVDYLNEAAFKKRLPGLASPFPQDPSEDVLRDYKGFFASIGSHVIINTTFGSRFQFCAWASNSDSSVNNRFSANVQTQFNGVMTNGDFDSSVKTEPQYKTFQEFIQTTASVRGGDADLAQKLREDPSDYETYVEWTRTTLTSPEIMLFQTTEVWNLMREASSSDVRQRANDIQDAYEYILSHPRPYSTVTTFSINSNVAEFGLITPSAVIVVDPETLPEDTISSTTKITWGKGGVKTKEVNIQFEIVNDGSPVDFYIVQGNKKIRKGEATISLAGTDYVNNKIENKKTNALWFYQAPVVSEPAPSKWVIDNKQRTWSGALEEYLDKLHLESQPSQKPLEVEQV